MLEIAAASPPGTFFDFTPLQLLTSASLARVRALHPAGRIDAARYRPNVIIDTEPGLTGFVENDWPGHRLHLGLVAGRGRPARRQMCGCPVDALVP